MVEQQLEYGLCSVNVFMSEGGNWQSVQSSGNDH